MSFEIGRGTDISHWLSQSGRRGRERQAWFTRDDLRKIAGLGLDHIRLPIDEEQMWTEAGGREPEAWDLMNACLDWCGGPSLTAPIERRRIRARVLTRETNP